MTRVTSVWENQGHDATTASVIGYLRPPRITLRGVVKDAAREWRKLRSDGFPRRRALAFVALRIVQGLAYAKGWKEGGGRRR